MGLLSWFALTAALCFGSLVALDGKRFQKDVLSQDEGTLMALLGKRDVEKEGSCSSSPIQGNVTLKGGIHAGYFRKLAQYVAMQLCVELCCEEKGCDVAFMSGKNCYGVQCFSEELCQAIPTKKHAPESILISHVTIKGEGGVKQQEPTNLKCSATRMKVGVTLRGGLKSGNFTDVGKVDGMPMCTKLCCVSEKCDLALTINNNCFLVSCFSKELCQAVQAISMKFKPSVAYVMRKTGQLMNDTASKLEALHTIDSKLMCKNSQIFNNSTLKGGYKAGNFTDLGKVANMSVCVRLCCGDKNCDAAFMLENNCYAINCLDEDTCTPVRAKKTSALVALNPRLSYITSRSEEVLGKNQMTKDGTCHAGVISYDVTLRGGMNAGKFTPHGKLNSMEMCIAKCCQSPLCSVAMMLKDACFTVECVKDEFCEKRPTPTSSKFNPRIAYVFRDRQINGKHFKHFGNSKKFKTKTLLNRNNSTLIFHPQTTSLKDNHEVLNGDHIKELKGKELLSTKSIPRNHIKKTDQAQYLNERPTEIKSNSFHTSNKNPQNLMHSVPFADDFDTQENSIKEKSDIYNIKERNSQNNTSLDALPAPMLKARIGNNKSEGNIQISHNIKKDAMKTLNYVPNNSINLSEVSKTKTMGTILSNSSEIKPASQMKFISNKEKISVTRNETKKDHEVISKELIPDEVPPIVPGLDDDAEDPSCTNSKTMYDVTLRGGMASGTFKDRGKLQYFSECLKICCIAGSCDLAFMLGDNCYSVQCHSERLCEAVPARSSKFSPRIAYIYARTA